MATLLHAQPAQRLRVAGTTSTMSSPSLTMHLAARPAVSPLTARSSVDLPEPDRPISTEISPSLDVESGAGAAEHRAGLLEDLGCGSRPASSSASALGVAPPKTMSTLLEDRRPSVILALPLVADRRRHTRSRMMASTTMARPASKPIGMLTVLSARTTGLPRPSAPISAAITTIDSDSMMHLGQAGHDRAAARRAARPSTAAGAWSRRRPRRPRSAASAPR